FIISYMPWIGAGAGLLLSGMMAVSSNVSGVMGAVGATLLLFSLGWLLKRMFSYPHIFTEPRTVRSLVSEVEVSGVRPIPCVMEGEIIGRGIPGLFWSEDLVLQDDGGYIIMDYRQPLRILEILFGWVRAEKLVGKRVRAYGWYRRTARPYFELRRLEFEDGSTVTSYIYPVMQFFIYMGIALGAVILGLAALM
ncbi:MAG: hypothetical protein GYB65_09510, partial [Chloroflexi bacterium]|nr:hypothetical protein [Chloroflexota bacterium]